MSFIDGFKYPFRSLAKLFTIVLAFSILIVLVSIFSRNTYSLGGVTTLAIVLGFAQSFFLTGYGIRIVRHLMDGWKKLPQLQIAKDIGRGVVVVFSGIIVYMPLVLLFFCGGMSGMSFDYLDTGNQRDFGSFFGTLVVMIPVFVYLTWGFTVGMARFAAEERRKALFEYSQNFSIVNRNIGASLRLTFYNFIMLVIYSIVGAGVDQIYTNITSGMLTFPYDPNTLTAVIAFGSILTLTLSLFQQFGNLHFMYQYADRIGIGRGDEKVKHSDYT